MSTHPVRLLRWFRALVGLAVLIAFSTASRAAPPRTIAFQGVLTDASGVPLHDGIVTFVEFRLYDHLTGPTQLWSESKSVTVAGGHGVFTTALGSSIAFPASLPFDQPYYLSIELGGNEEMTPRIPLQSVPYALALSLPFSGTATVAGPGTAFSVTNPGNGTAISGVGLGGNGVYGVNGSPSGLAAAKPFGYGVKGESANGFGVVGQSGNAWGVYGQQGPASGVAPPLVSGVWGDSHDNIGVFGATANATSYGVAGFNGGADNTVDANNFGVGVYGESTVAGIFENGAQRGDPGGIGVQGLNGKMLGIGVEGQAIGQSGTGVEGFGDEYGVAGYSEADFGTGVYGYTHGTGFGVFGGSNTGTGIVGRSGGSGNGRDTVVTYLPGVGVEGEGSATGVYGLSNGNGVYGQTFGANASGVYGKNLSGGPSVAGYFPPSGNGVGLFAGDLGSFGIAAIESNMSRSTTHIYCAENGQEVFAVNGGGNVFATSYKPLSDGRLKRNVQPLQDALASILQLRGVSYDWRQDTGRAFPQGRQIGMIAQEVQKVLPEVVAQDVSGYFHVGYESVVPVLVEGVKAQQTEIATLQCRNAALEGEDAALKTAVAGQQRKNADLEARLSRLEQIVGEARSPRR